MQGKILVVDDSKTARKIIKDHLNNPEITVIEAVDGSDGLKKLEQHPDVFAIFSDINMPFLNGLEMVEKIKELPNLAHIPICMLTTESAPEALDQAKKLGVNAFLVKPINDKQLAMVLKNFYEAQ